MPVSRKIIVDDYTKVVDLLKQVIEEESLGYREDTPVIAFNMEGVVVNPCHDRPPGSSRLCIDLDHNVWLSDFDDKHCNHAYMGSIKDNDFTLAVSKSSKYNLEITGQKEEYMIRYTMYDNTSAPEYWGKIVELGRLTPVN
jgi:hypothetical protein